MKVLDIEQGSGAWFAARAGKVTASCVADAVSFLKRGDGETAARAAYKAQIVAEILRGEPIMDGYLSPYMQHGTEQEPYARAAYESRFDVLVDTVGFVVHPTIERAGASPDGLVGDDGGLEIKCPKTETHIRYMRANRLPPEYEPQVMWNLACTGRTWWDFVSFDPFLPPRHQIFRIRVERNAGRIAELEQGVKQFLSEVDAMIAELNEINPEIERKLSPPEADGIEDLGITEDDLDRYLPL